MWQCVLEDIERKNSKEMSRIQCLENGDRKLMAYNCKHCKFKWHAWDGNFQKVLDHEKTHLKTKQTHIIGETTA